MTEIRFTIPVEPVPASRPRVTQRGVAYYPKKHTAYANYLKDYLSSTVPLAAQGPVSVQLLFVMPPYKTSSSPVHRSDVDNLAKLPLDAMTKSVTELGTNRFWTDDSLVVDLQIFKRFARPGEAPHTKIKIAAIEGSVEDYVDRRFNQ